MQADSTTTLEVVASQAAGAPLSSLRRGQSGVICESRLDPEDAALLRAMGLSVGATVRVVREGEPCVVGLGADGASGCGCGGMCRIGLARGLAAKILVRPG